MRSLLITYVWPEPNASAAGARDMSLIEIFLKAGWEVTCLSPSKENAFSEKIRAQGVATVSMGPNDSRFDEFISQLKPDFVLFDRFVTEEQFGWRVHEHSPETIRVLDTQDLHFLRRARQRVLDGGALDLVNDDSLREIASIYRSDLTLILSDFEINLLMNQFRVPEHLLALSRFCYPDPTPQPFFKERENFVMIGNFRHPPNADGVLWLKREIWPHIHDRLPRAQAHIYGAYPSREMMALTDAKIGFHVKGSAPDAIETLRSYRINLAPLRFGAGIKGKITDGWSAGTPVVSTPVGAEGMHGGLPWGGAIESEPRAFAERAISLYTDETLWSEARENGFRILKGLFHLDANSKKLIDDLLEARKNASKRRTENFIGAMLQHHFHKSTTYFSKWIELKEERATPAS